MLLPVITLLCLRSDIVIFGHVNRLWYLITYILAGLNDQPAYVRQSKPANLFAKSIRAARTAGIQGLVYPDSPSHVLCKIVSSLLQKDGHLRRKDLYSKCCRTVRPPQQAIPFKYWQLTRQTVECGTSIMQASGRRVNYCVRTVDRTRCQCAWL